MTIRMPLRACIIDNLINWPATTCYTIPINIHLRVSMCMSKRTGFSSTSSACSITSCRLERVNLLKSTSCIFFLDLLGTSAFFEPAFCKAWSTRSSKSCCLRDSRSPALAAWSLAAPCGAWSLTSTAASTTSLSVRMLRI